MSSRIATGGRTYSIRSLVGGESVPSVTSNGSRSGRASSAVAATAPAGPRGGAKVAEFGAALGTAAGIAVSSSQAPVWPGDLPGPTGTTLSLRPFVAVVVAAAAAAF